MRGNGCTREVSRNVVDAEIVRGLTSCRQMGQDVVSIRAGAEGETMTVHVDVLPPHLFSMATEAAEDGIKMPESPEAIRRMLAYLYSNTKAVRCDDLPGHSAVEVLAELYDIASRYQVPGLQKLTFHLLWRRKDFRCSSMSFFRISAKVLSVSPSSDKALDAAFIKLFACKMHLPRVALLIDSASLRPGTNQECSHEEHHGTGRCA